MLKRRIAAVLIVKDGIVVQSIGFRRYQPVGKPSIAVDFLNQWGIDEIILLDISASRMGRGPDFELIRSTARYCRVPLTVGGGITCLEHIHELMHCGADKVALNQMLLRGPDLLSEAASLFGNQCIVASIDVRQEKRGYRVYDYMNQQSLEILPSELAASIQSSCAGEILLNSVDRDGLKSGFDIDLINLVVSSVEVPVIACGGAGCPSHFLEALESTSASAIAAANFFHFYEHSVTITKAHVERDHLIRHETHALYDSNDVDGVGRLLKKPDSTLEKLFYIRIEKEVI